MADSRLITVERGRRVTFTLDGDEIAAYEGETVAAALVAADRWQIRRSARLALPRGIYCNMGVCYDCLVIHQGRRCPRRSARRLPLSGPAQLAWPPPTSSSHAVWRCCCSMKVNNRVGRSFASCRGSFAA
jgi:sarcosine oxidase subunit alpha